jgi:hypothetical protein
VAPAVTEERFPFYDSFNLPSTVLGLTKNEIYTGASMLLITTVALMFGAVDVGIGGVLLVGVLGVMKFFNWFQEMTWGLWTFLFTIAIAFMFVERRRRTD